MISNQEENTKSNDNINHEKLSKKYKQFSYLSYEITKLLDTKTKKENGIFFTPSNIIQICIEEIIKFSDQNNLIINDILEPCCGSCEFIKYIDSKFNNKNIIGIENNNFIFEKIKNISSNKNKIELLNKSFFDFNGDKFDLIIGNPPFYVISKSNIDQKYGKYFDGRPNIFLLFIINSLKKLNNKGLLCFVLPINFLNCLYYDKLRSYINSNYFIVNIINCNCNNYIDTQQETIIFIVQKIKNKIKNNNHCIILNKYNIFNDKKNIDSMKNLLLDSKSLYSLGFDVKVGNIVWNENKGKLTNDDTKTLLIYNSNIKNNEFNIVNFKNTDKKNYIDIKGKKDIVLLLNRGYGKGEYTFNYFIVNMDKEYLIENHLIYIYYRNQIDNDKLINYFEKIIKSFKNQKTKEFISIYFGNNAINTNELKHILPIYFD